MMRYLLALFTLFLALPSWVGAQGPVQVFEGDRVRVTAPDCELYQQAATLRTIQDGVLSATVDGSQIQCPVESLTRLEVSLGKRGWRRDAVRGMRYGALLGLAAGVVIVATAEPDDGFPTVDALLVTAGMGAAGFLVGAGLNAMRDPEDWLDVSLSPPRAQTYLSGVGRVQFGFSIPIGR
jgi:hypothetical protein